MINWEFWGENFQTVYENFRKYHSFISRYLILKKFSNSSYKENVMITTVISPIFAADNLTLLFIVFIIKLINSIKKIKIILVK